MRTPQWLRDLDTSVSRYVTPTARCLIYVNLAVWLASTLVFALFRVAEYASFLGLFACSGSAILEGRVWQFATYMFLHIDLGHLFFNMLMLWFFGSVLEQLWGGRRFLRFYLLCGALAAVCYEAVMLLRVSVFDADPALLLIPMLGASGALYGVLFAFGYLFPDQPVLLGFLIPVPARVLVALLVFFSFMGSINPGGDNTAHLCHLTGMGVAYVYLRWPWGWRGPQRVRRFHDL